MKRFTDIVTHPRNNECPLYDGKNEPDCMNCHYCAYIGSFGGGYYVNCNAVDENDEE